MFVWLKKLSGAFSNGMWLSGRPDLAPFDLDTEREVKEMTVAGGHRGELVEDDEMTVDEIVTLDTEIMGVERCAWVQHLYDNPEVRLYGFRKKKRLIAALALRPRKGDSWGLDMVHGIEFADISSLVQVVLGDIGTDPRVLTMNWL